MKKVLPYILIFVVGILVIGGLAFAGVKLLQNKGAPPPSSRKSEEERKEEKKKERAAKQEALLELVKELSQTESPGTTFSLGIYDLKNDEYFGFNDTEMQHAASVSKVLTATYVFSLAEKGEVDLAEPLGAYNIETQIKFLINQSSEDSWYLLDGRFKPEAQNEFAKSLGLTATDVRLGQNKMSPKDVTILLKKLAKGELLNDLNRSKLFSYMQKTESENFFSPAFQQRKINFYHKTGKYLGEGHDAAIVKHPKNPFVLVVFSNNNTILDPNERAPAMKRIAEVVLEYFDELQLERR